VDRITKDIRKQTDKWSTSKISYNRYTLSDRYIDEVKPVAKLRDCSSKYARIIEDIVNCSDQPAFVFIEEVTGSALLLFSAILEAYGYSLYDGESVDVLSERLRYTLCVGDKQVCPNPEDRIAGFNDKRNSRDHTYL